MELSWDYYRELVPSGGGLGSVVHYFDESAQSLYLNSSGVLISDSGEVPEGHWSSTILPVQSQIASGFSKLGISHPVNGALYFVTSGSAGLQLMRYAYMLDITDIVDSGGMDEQIDSGIKQVSLDVKNTSPDIFTLQNTLFNPGARVSFVFSAGDSEHYNMGAIYLDEIDYDAYAETVSISGRNIMGFALADQTFDDATTFGGTRKMIVEQILAVAGVKSSLVYNDSTFEDLMFEASDNILDGLTSCLNLWEWKYIEAPNGTIICGPASYISSYFPAGRYTFDGGEQVFRRKTTKRLDAAYTRVCVTQDYETIFKEVPSWPYWKLGKQKTKYVTANNDVEDLDAFATKLAQDLQYVGIGENFSGPIRPHLQPGDIAEIFYEGDAEATTLGVITSIHHTFGGRGFSTDFSIDSGGMVYTEGEYEIVSAVSALNGYNRKQKILDLIGAFSEKKIAYSSAKPVKKIKLSPENLSTTPASIMRVC